MKNNLVYAISGIIQNMIGLILAALICSRVKMKAQGLYKTILFLPYIINITAVAYMFNYVYDFREGPINLLLKALGGDPIRFLSDEKMVIYSLVFISFWKWLGFTMLLYIAAINSISAEIYEASEVDGASSWQSFLHVTLPNIVKILELQMFLAMSGALQAFVEPFVMTKGGPDNASSTFLFYIINIYTKYNDYGFAAALSVILILMILLITVIQRGAILGRRRHE